MKMPFLRNYLLNIYYYINYLNGIWLNKNVFDAELGFTNCVFIQG